MTPETNPPIFASLKAATRVELKSQTAPSSPFRGKDEHIEIVDRSNSFLQKYADFFEGGLMGGDPILSGLRGEGLTKT